MINYLNQFLNKIKNGSIGYRIVIGFILLFYISIILMAVIKTDYYMLTPGTVSSVGSVIELDTDYTSGEVYTVSVFENQRISVLNYIIASFEKNVEINKLPENTMSQRNEDIKGYLLKQTSINASIIVAYNEAKLKDDSIQIKSQFLGYVVCNRVEGVDEDLHLEDIITHVNDIKITSFEQMQSIIKDAKNSKVKTIKMTVLRDGKIDGRINDDATKLKSYNLTISLNNLTFSVLPYYDIIESETKPSFTINNNKVQGSSGGLMQTIAIYNALTKGDITKNKIIMGTGSIDVDGNVGIIGGEKQKVITADLYSADIFFVPDGNYTSALEQYQKIKNPDFKLIKVKNFKQAIAELEKLEGAK